ncbi:hypothetical protein N4R57_08365 [Rhodobacteraceae bacterium D3-12]|nr:hypothetical protein N4R57_08365 [Rhodobacteraceae bacterium D3-12]
MSKRAKTLAGIALALVWSVGILWWPQTVKPPFIPLNTAMVMALLPGELCAQY